MTSTLQHRSLATMPAHARIWIYKSAMPFTADQRAAMDSAAQDFVAEWSSHGRAMDAWAGTHLDHFLVIAADQEQAVASGCGIDKSVRFVQELERSMGLTLTDRMVLVYTSVDGMRTARVQDVPALLDAGVLAADTIVYDDLVTNKGEFDARFRAQLADTWLARYL